MKAEIGLVEIKIIELNKMSLQLKKTWTEKEMRENYNSITLRECCFRNALIVFLFILMTQLAAIFSKIVALTVRLSDKKATKYFKYDFTFYITFVPAF